MRLRSHRLPVAWSALLALAGAGLARADEEPPILAGARVRVSTLDSSRRVIGTLARIEGGALILAEPGGQDRAIRVITIARLEVSRGDQLQVKRGLLRGALVGLGLMAIDAAQGCWGCALPRTWLVFVGIPVAVGGLMGATDRAEAWRAVPLTRLREGDRPARPLPLISFAVRF